MARKNFSFGIVAIAPSPADSGLTLSLETGDIASFSTSFPYIATVGEANATHTNDNATLITITGITGDQITFTRQAESSNNRTILVGDEVYVGFTAGEHDKLVANTGTSTDRAIAIFDGATGKFVTNATSSPTINTSGALVINAAGTVSAPTIVYGSNQTGIWFPANFKIGFVVGNAEKFRITGSGVMIGNQQDPTTQLGLYGTGASNGITIGEGVANPVNLYRSAADTLKTDDSFVVGGTLAVTGAASASNLSGTNTGDQNLSGLQPLDATLTSLAAFNTNGILVQTAADTFTGRTITGTANQVTVSDGNGVSGNPTLSLPQDIHTGASPTFVGGTFTGNTTIAGYSRVGSNSAPTNTTAGDLTAVRFSLGNSAAFSASAGYILSASGTLTDTSSGAKAFSLFANTISPTSNSSSEFRALYFQNILNASTGVTLNVAEAGFFENIIGANQSGLVSEVYGVFATGLKTTSSSNASATVGTITGLRINTHGRASGTSSVAATTGIAIDTGTTTNGSGYTYTDYTHIKMANVSADSVGTQIGIDIGTLTRGTTDIGIRIAKSDTYSLQLSDTGGTAAGGVTFGTDTTLYRIAADVLATDDSMRMANYLRVGSTTAPTNTTAGDFMATRLQVALSGNGSAFGSSGRIAMFSGTSTGTAAAADIFFNVSHTITPTSNSASNFRSLQFQNVINPATGITFTNSSGIVAGYFENRLRSDGTITQLTGVQSLPMFLDASSASTSSITTMSAFLASAYATSGGTTVATIGTAVGFDSQFGNSGTASAVVTTLIGFRATNAGTGHTLTTHVGVEVGSLTRAATNIGIRIALPSGGATANYALQFSDTTGVAAGGITFGTDVQLHRSAANVLRLQDKLLIDLDLEIDGALDHDGTTAGFFGVTPATRPTALTTADANTINSGDATTDTIIANMRTRINELETKLQSLGLLS